MSDGRTIWFPLDTGWWRREHVVELGEEFGPVGPAVLMWLSCEAKVQNDGGRVKAGPKTVARGVFADAVTVGHVLSRAVALGALHGWEEHDGRFMCSISGWSKDNERGRNSFRKADSRAKTDDVVTDGHGESPPVTEVPQREEKRKGLASNDASQGARERKRVDQDAAPDDLSPELAERLQPVLDILARIHRQRGGNEPSVRGVGLALQAFPQRDHLAIAHELEHWAIAGRGQRREIRDWVRQYRSFLDRADAASPTRPARMVGNHLQRHPADDRVAELLARAEEERVREAAA